MTAEHAEAHAAAPHEAHDQSTVTGEPPAKRKRGRPKGTKNREGHRAGRPRKLLPDGTPAHPRRARKSSSAAAPSTEDGPVASTSASAQQGSLPQQSAPLPAPASLLPTHTLAPGPSLNNSKAAPAALGLKAAALAAAGGAQHQSLPSLPSSASSTQPLFDSHAQAFSLAGHASPSQASPAAANATLPIAAELAQRRSPSSSAHMIDAMRGSPFLKPPLAQPQSGAASASHPVDVDAQLRQGDPAGTSTRASPVSAQHPPPSSQPRPSHPSPSQRYLSMPQSLLPRQADDLQAMNPPIHHRHTSTEHSMFASDFSNAVSGFLAATDPTQSSSLPNQSTFPSQSSALQQPASGPPLLDASPRPPVALPHHQAAPPQLPAGSTHAVSATSASTSQSTLPHLHSSPVPASQPVLPADLPSHTLQSVQAAIERTKQDAAAAVPGNLAAHRLFRLSPGDAPLEGPLDPALLVRLDAPALLLVAVVPQPALSPGRAGEESPVGSKDKRRGPRRCGFCGSHTCKGRGGRKWCVAVQEDVDPPLASTDDAPSGVALHHSSQALPASASASFHHPLAPHEHMPSHSADPQRSAHQQEIANFASTSGAPTATSTTNGFMAYPIDYKAARRRRTGDAYRLP